MDPRFVLQKVEYMWTDLDQVHAKQIRQAYDAERATGKGHADALNALRGKFKEHEWHASPYKMLIPLFTQAHPQKLWDEIILPGQKVVLSRKEFAAKCPGKGQAQRQIDRFKIWKKTRCSNVEWQKVRGAEREAVRGAGSLGAAFKALHGLDPKRFPSALYGMKSTGFRRFVRYVFEFWGNTEYRYRATRPGHGFDYAHQTKTIVTLKPVIDGVSIDYVPVFVPPKTTQPVTPGKNKIAATKPPGFEAHIGKLKEYARINAECEQHMDNLHSHQARCESLARTFETFHQIYPSLKPSSLPKAAAAMRRLANLTDKEVFEKDAGLFTRAPAFSFGGLVRPSAPTSPPFEAGIKATEDIVRLLTEDPEFAKSAHGYVKHAVDRQRGTQGTMAEIADAVGAIRMVDDTLAGNVVERFCDHVLAAPDVGVTASSQLSQPGQAALIPLLEANGTRIAWRAIKLVPEVVGNFQGPPSFTVALVNAAGFLGAKHLNSNGVVFKAVKKLFDKSTAARLQEAVASKSTEELESFLTKEFQKARDPKVWGGKLGTPLPAASKIQRGSFLLHVVAVYQLIALVRDLHQVKPDFSDPDAALKTVQVGLDTFKTVTVSAEALSKWRFFRKLLSNPTNRIFQRCNIAFAALTGVVGAAQNLEAARQAWQKGDHALGIVRLTKYTGNVALLILMVVPHPVAQAGIMFLLLSMEALDAYFSNTPQDTEITSGRVNVHLRNLIKLGGSPRNPLSVFLTDAERDALAEVELICNAQDIKHPAAGSTFDPLGIVALDVEKLRHVGFSLEEIKELTGCPWLTVEELQ